MSPAQVTSLTSRRERRVSIRHESSRAKKWARRTGPALSPVRETVDSLKAETLRGDYTILGRVESMSTPAGKMLFLSAGPVIAQLKESGSLAFLTDWPGLPEIKVPTDQPCPACLNECEVCEGKKRVLCKHKGCGGAGYLRHNPEACPKCLGSAKKKTNPKCANCNGSGIVFKKEKCPECKGRGKQKCDVCKGKGECGTGKTDGSYDVHERRCRECDGYAKKIEAIPQDVEKFVDRVVERECCAEGLCPLGPITRMIVTEMEGGYVNGFAVIEPASDPPAAAYLMIDQRASERPMYLVGGGLKMRLLKTA